MGFQYVTVRLPMVTPGESSEHVWTERLNQVAAEGWRLITITSDVHKGYTLAYGTFEREVAT